MVMMKPRTKPRAAITQTFLLRVMAEPTCSPMGDILISAPRVKNMVPTTMRAAPIKKHSRMLGDMGATEKHSTITIQMMGRTARRDSASFSFSFTRVVCKMPVLPFFPVFSCFLL